MNIGANIKKFRKERGLSQEQLAGLIDKSMRTVQKYESGDIPLSITRNSISRYESGVREPKIGTVEIISNALNITIEELITGEKLSVKTKQKDITMFTNEELIEELYRRINK